MKRLLLLSVLIAGVGVMAEEPTMETHELKMSHAPGKVGVFALVKKKPTECNVPATEHCWEELETTGPLGSYKNGKRQCRHCGKKQERMTRWEDERP